MKPYLTLFQNLSAAWQKYCGSILLLLCLSPVLSAQVTIFGEPDGNTIGVGDPLFITVKLDAGTNPVTSAQVSLSFDPAVLSVAAGSLTGSGNFTTIQNGTGFDNAAGTISYAGGFGDDLTGVFDVFSFTVNALAAAPSTEIVFTFQPFTGTDVNDYTVTPDDIAVTVSPGNFSPTVAILTPADNSSVERGTDLQFTATADDPEEGDLSAGLSWSSTDPQFNVTQNGSPVTGRLLAVGAQQVTASVADNEGAVGTNTIDLTVLPPSVVFVAPANNGSIAGTSITVEVSTDGMVLNENEHFHFYINPIDPDNPNYADRISTIDQPGETVFTFTPADGLVDGENTIVVIAADASHVEFLQPSARDVVDFTFTFCETDNGGCADSVTKFVLIDAGSDAPVPAHDPLVDGAILVKSNLPSLLDIQAITSPATVGSVHFALTGPIDHTKTESKAPYALFGDSNGNYNGADLPEGDYSLIATPYSESGASGTPGTADSIAFSVVNSQPSTCTVDGVSVSDISACNGEGTSNTSDDTFTANVTVTFTNPPATGNLVLSGDGAGSVAVGALSGGTHTFTNVPMSADGGPISLTAAFSAEPNCTLDEPNAGTAPAPCSPLACTVGSIGVSDFTPCDGQGTSSTGDDTFTANVTVTFTNPPATGNLVLSGDGAGSVAVGALSGGTHTFTNVPMSADGGPISLTAAFSAEPNCTLDEPNAGTAPAPCSPLACTVGSIGVSDFTPCDGQGTSSTGDDTFTANVTVTFTNPPATGNLVLSGDGAGSVAVGTLSGGTHTFTNVPMSADGGPISLTAAFSAEPNCTLDEPNAGTAPAPCSPLACTVGSIGVSDFTPCDGQGTSSTGDDTFTANVTVTFTNPPATGNLVLSGDGAGSVAVGALSGGTHTFTNVPMSADGGPISLTAAFSAEPNCTVSQSNAGTAPAACSTPSGPGIQKFVLINAATNLPVAGYDPLVNGAALPKNSIPTSLNVQAVPTSAVGSVKFVLSGVLNSTKTENKGPYALFGDANGNYSGVNMPAGSYTLTATPYSGSGGSGTAGTPYTINFTITTVPVCGISSISVSNLSSCNGQGTPSNSDDTFTANVMVTFVNKPATGNLVLSGDGTGTVPVGSLSGSSYTFTGVTMSTDGGPIALTAQFSANTACTLTNANAGTAPGPCSAPVCSLTSIGMANLSACNGQGTANVGDDTFTANVTVGFANPPTTGNLVLSGDGSGSVAVSTLTGTSYTFTGVTMAADGGAISLTAQFTADAACQLTNTQVGVAPASCSPPGSGSFALINANTDQPINGFNPIPNGSTINLATVGTSLNFAALIQPPPGGSVKLVLAGPTSVTKIEGKAPYALFGDINGNYESGSVAVGAYNLSATPYSGSGATGTAGTTVNVSFTVVNNASSGLATVAQTVTSPVPGGGPAETPVWRADATVSARPERLPKPAGIDVRLQPNPVTGPGLLLAFNQPVSQALQLLIVDQMGRVPYTLSLPGGVERRTIYLDLTRARLVGGMYFLRIRLADGTVLTHKFVRAE